MVGDVHAKGDKVKVVFGGEWLEQFGEMSGQFLNRAVSSER